jgi:hypothetical protein
MAAECVGHVLQRQGENLRENGSTILFDDVDHEHHMDVKFMSMMR